MIEIRQMHIDDVDFIYEIEKEQFVVPWTKQSFIKDLTENFCAIYFVAIYNGEIAGYLGLWHVITEGHMTNVAVCKKYEGKGIGNLLIKKMIDTAIEKEMIGLTLEVSTINDKALHLYKKYGFQIEGTRKEYYEVTKEDCYVMWLYF